MNRFDICIAAGPVVGFGASILLLFNYTDLPVWASLLISVPLGLVVGFIGGLIVGIIVEFVLYGQTEESRNHGGARHDHEDVAVSQGSAH